MTGSPGRYPAAVAKGGRPGVLRLGREVAESSDQADGDGRYRWGQALSTVLKK